MAHQSASPSLDSLTCPQCGSSIPLTDALQHELAERVGQELARQQQQLKRQEDALRLKEEAIEPRVRAQVEERRSALEKALMAKAKEETALAVKDLTAQVKEKEQQLSESRQKELELRRRERELEDKHKAFELEVERRLGDERRKVEEATTQRVQQEQRLREAEKDKQIADMLRQIDDLKRKAEQGSQQTQGEVMELEMEQLLKATFPYDDIQPVAKGKPGADVIQRVFNKSGLPCGSIIWESKRTKHWSDPWITKLKDDQREAQADIAVIVSEVLPKDITLFAPRDGVWVTTYAAFPGLATALRESLIQVALTRLAVKGKDEKMEVLFTYLTGPEFRQRVEVIFETFTTMKTDLDKEKLIYTRQWAKREKQIARIIGNTAGMYGDLQGLIGESMQPIPALESGQDDDGVLEDQAPMGADLPF